MVQLCPGYLLLLSYGKAGAGYPRFSGFRFIDPAVLDKVAVSGDNLYLVQMLSSLSLQLTLNLQLAERKIQHKAPRRTISIFSFAHQAK
jgi:hypothetical protein